MNQSAIRNQYVAHGVEGYYSQYGGQYTNPHERQVRLCINHGLATWKRDLLPPAGTDTDTGIDTNLQKSFKVLDLACGSGEATRACQLWIESQNNVGNSASDSVLSRLHIARPLQQTNVTSDKAAAATEEDSGRIKFAYTACDPFTADAFTSATSLPCLSYSFRDIAQGCLDDHFADCEGVADEDGSFDLAICSFALHLLDNSNLFATLDALARRAKVLMVLSPHKRPVIESHMGWQQHEHTVIERVHVWLYTSIYRT
ncbi:hypothetical protein GQ42DRAFT_162873 [Ramicandelaber brevisporus]|nr:hypothetical protein GQ42DRAFT_162873 [Ramicandelaber brevisporus]